MHRLAGGIRAVELLGPDESDIWFQGVFSGRDAESRTRALDTLRIAGDTVRLTWQSFQYDVIVRTFRARYSNPWWINYTVGLLVVGRLVASASPTVTQPKNLRADLAAGIKLIPECSVDLTILLDRTVLNDALLPGTEANRRVKHVLAAAIEYADLRIATLSDTLRSAPGAGDRKEKPELAISAQAECAGLLSTNLNARAIFSRALSLVCGKHSV